jgi:hypothetical protein
MAPVPELLGEYVIVPGDSKLDGLSANSFLGGQFFCDDGESPTV